MTTIALSEVLADYCMDNSEEISVEESRAFGIVQGVFVREIAKREKATRDAFTRRDQ